MPAAQPDREVGGGVAVEVNAEGDELAEVGGQRCTGNAQGRHRAKAKDEHRVQCNVAYAACDQRDHRGVHPAYGLEHLLEGKVGHVDDGEQEDDGGVEDAHRDQRLLRGEPAQKARHDGDARHGAQQAVQDREGHAVGGGDVRLFAVACTEVECDLRVDANAEADGDGVDEVLHREHQRQGRHGLLADAGDEEAVHDVVQRVHQHRDDVGQGHRDQQREHRSGFHKGIVHFLLPF